MREVVKKGRYTCRIDRFKNVKNPYVMIECSFDEIHNPNERKRIIKECGLNEDNYDVYFCSEA